MQVGAALFLSHKTVEFHLGRIYRKLNVNSRAELIRQFAASEDCVRTGPTRRPAFAAPVQGSPRSDRARVTDRIEPRAQWWARTRRRKAMNLKKLVLLGVVVAALAAGVSYAGIPSSNGTISACVDSRGGIKVIDAEAGENCGTGKQTLTWNQQGPAGAPGLSGYEVVTSNTAYTSDDEKGIYAQCPEGKLPIGGGGEGLTYQFGGGFGQFGGAHIVASKPTAGRSWSVTARETVATSKDWILRAYVVCAAVQ